MLDVLFIEEKIIYIVYMCCVSFVVNIIIILYIWIKKLGLL